MKTNSVNFLTGWHFLKWLSFYVW